jgi:hypothetical protein
MDFDHAPYGSHLNPLLPFNHPKKFQNASIPSLGQTPKHPKAYTTINLFIFQFNDVVEMVIIH